MRGDIPYLGCVISLISRKTEIRYEGILCTEDTKESTVKLAEVRSFGTEDRCVERPVAPRDEVYEYIIFRASDIKDLHVCEPTRQTLNSGLLNDPAIVKQSVPQMPVSNLSVSQSTGQQSSPGAVSVARSAVAAPAPTADPETRKLIQQQLVLLLHAHKCQRRENQSNGKGRKCFMPHCRTMKHVLSHMCSCSVGKSCAVPHCSSSRQIISHWKNCTRCDCPVCLPLKQAFRGDKLSSDRRQQAVNDQVPQCSPQNLNHIQTQQTAQNPQSQVQLRSIIQNSGSGAMASHSAQNFLLADNLQSKVKAGNVALINAPPVVPGGLPDNPATVKDWRQSITQDLRHHLVQKIVQTIFPTTDESTLQDDRMIKLVTYARKVEGDMYGAANSMETRMINLVNYACKVEGDMYEAANSREEYYQLLAEKIYKIQKELEEKRQKRKEGRLQQIQQVGPSLGPMIGSNSGAPSPSAISQKSAVESSCGEKMDVDSEVKSGSGKSESVTDSKPVVKIEVTVKPKQESEGGAYATGSSIKEEPVINEEPSTPQSAANATDYNSETKPDSSSGTSQPPPKLKPNRKKNTVKKFEELLEKEKVCRKAVESWLLSIKETESLTINKPFLLTDKYIPEMQKQTVRILKISLYDALEDLKQAEDAVKDATESLHLPEPEQEAKTDEASNSSNGDASTVAEVIGEAEPTPFSPLASSVTPKHRGRPKKRIISTRIRSASLPILKRITGPKHNMMPFIHQRIQQ